MNKSVFSKFFSAILIVMLALAALPVAPARAATIVVNTTTDENTAAGSNCSLREAIIAANTDAAYNGCTAGSGADTITLTSGLIYSLSLAGTNEDASLTGDLDITSASGLTITTSSTGTATIDANDIDRIFDVRPNANFTLNNIIVTNGTATVGGGMQVAGTGTTSVTGGAFTNNLATGAGTNNGGAIYVNGNTSPAVTTLNLTAVTLSGNSADDDGGAIYITGTGSTVTISDNVNDTSIIQNNNAAAINNGAGIYLNAGSLSINGTAFTNNDTSNGFGGAIYQNGGTLNIGTTTGNSFTNNDATIGGGNNGAGGAIYKTAGTMTIGAAGVVNTFTTNTTDGTGGAIYVDNTGSYSITAATFTSNTAAEDGGAIHNFNETATIAGSTFTSNTATNNDGGAIFHDEGGTLTITSGSFSTNTAPNGNGGAIATDQNLSITSSTFTSNSADGEGGAIDNNGGTSTITSSTFTSNSSTADRGGAVSNHGGGSSLTVTTSTFSSNTAAGTGGGAFYNSGTLSITNSTLNANSVNGTLDGGAIYANGGTLTVQNSTFFGNQTTTTSGSLGGAIYGQGNPTFNISFVSFSDNRASISTGPIPNGSDIHLISGTFNLYRSFLVNPVNTGVNCFSAATDTVVNSLIEGNSTGNPCGATASTPFADTLILANNGGTTQTLAITSAITGIYNAATACTNSAGTTVSTDQRGTSRPLGANCDLGAFEAPANTAPTGGNGSVTTNEDTTYTFTVADFTTSTTPPYADAESNPFAGIRVTSLETAGTLQCGGVDVPLNGTCADVTTLTFAPAANANGLPYANFQFQVYDGSLYSTSSYTMTVNVTAVNDEPSFGVSGLIPAVNEDAGAVSVPGWIAVFNRGGGPDEASQTALNWIVSNSTCGSLLSAGPSVTGNTLSYTTAANANGTCTFDLQVQDSGGTDNGGDDTSPAGNYTITVNAVNDAPSFTASNPPAVNEDAGAQNVSGWATGFNPGGGTDEAGQTIVSYNISNSTCATLLSAGPSVNVAGDLSYTPAPDQNGSCTFDVSVQDNGSGTAPNVNTSSVQNFTITVNAVNDAPSFTASNPPAVNEDAGAQTVSSWATFNPGGGMDESAQTATYSVSNSTCGTLLSAGPTVNSAGDLSYTPAANQNGTCTFDVSVQDDGGTANGGDDTSGTQNFTITVNAVNDAPTITAPGSIAVTEDVASALTGISFADVDAGAGSVSVILSVPSGTLTATSGGGVTVSGSGTGNLNLTGTIADINTFIASSSVNFTTALNATSSVTMNVEVNDNANSGGAAQSTNTNVTLFVTAVNDAPSFTAGANPPAVNEDAGAQNVSGWATGFNPGGGTDEASQTVASYNISNSTCATLLSAGPSVSVAGDLSYTPAPDQNGSCTFDVAVQDSGSGIAPNVNTSAATTVTITVNAVNDAPSFTASNPPAVNEDAGAQTVSSWATFNPGGGTDESAQTATYSVSNSTCGTLLSAGPTVNSAGDLSYTPAANQNGTCTFDVSVQDAGGTANGGDDTSGTQNFTITVNALDDNPTGGNDAVTTLEDTTYTFQTSDFTYNDVEGSPFSGIRVTTLESTGTLQCGGVDVPLNGTCADVTTLTFAPVSNENGAPYATFQFQVSDGSLYSTSSYTMTINVTAVNDAPSFTASNPPAVNEDAGAQTVSSWATFNPGGGTDESAQTATYSVSNSTCGTLLSAGPTVNSSGDLAYTPAANQNGTCTFDVSVQDSGSGTAPNVNTSGAQNFTITVNAVNDAPTVANPIPNQNATEDTAFNFQFAANTFSDPDVGDTLTYSAQLNGGGALPGWLSFDAVTRTFSGTPTNSDVGTVAIDVIADDGNGGTVTDTFNIVVANSNDAPTVANAIPNQNATEDTAFNFQFAANTFSDPDVGDTLTYSAQLNGGGALPGWLSFDPVTRTFSGTPTNSDVGTVAIDVIADDGNGGTVTDTFNIFVAGVNDAPTQSAAADQFRTNGTTAIPQGSLTNESSVVFKATATDEESDQYTLEVEVVDNAASFTDTATCTSPLTNSGSEANTGSCGPLASGSYKWQYRFVDSGSSATAWTAFAGSDPDFIVDNGSPTVTNVTSTNANGTYFAGNTITIEITFSEAVTVTGTPQLLLELGAVDGLANYVSGSGSNTLTFTYTIVTGDNTIDLDYVANTSLTLNGGSIQDAALNNADLTLPTPSAAGSLGANKAIVIDALILVVTNNGVGSVPDTGDGSISENEQVTSALNINQLIVRFNKDVYNPADDTDADDVTNPANYILVRSNTIPAGNFNTISCAGGVVAPDIQTPVTSVTYNNGGGSGPFEATLTLSAPLTTNGYYRLYVCGTTSIVQANNTTLALAGNNTTNDSDFIRNFQITTQPTNGGGGDGDGDGRDNRALTVTALPATGFAPNRVTLLPEQPAAFAYASLGDIWIEIPSLGVKTSIVGVPQTSSGEWDVKWLGNDVGWLTGTAFPSWEGNSVVTAHVTNASGLEGPFANLKNLKYGDQIIIHAFGEKYIFEVRNSRLARPFSTSFAFEDLEDQSYLTLITCQVYLPKSDTYLFRRVVRAVLVSVESE